MLKFSIVTPTFNQGKFIEQTIQSVKNQNYGNIEHIVIDGGSKDQTLDILKKYQHLKWISEPDKGQIDAALKGMKMISGDIFGWINSDDMYFENIFPQIAEFFDKNPNVAAIYGDYHWIDEKGQFIKKIRELSFNRHRLLFHNFMAHPTVFIRTSVFDKIGIFRSDLEYTMDLEYWFRLCDTFNIAHIPLFIAKLRLHPFCKTYLHKDKQKADAVYTMQLHEKLFADINKTRWRWVLWKLYYMWLKELLEFRSNPLFNIKKWLWNLAGLLSFHKFDPPYQYRIRY
jgi:glycosyltransferase involved in cell wall biosynthesis